MDNYSRNDKNCNTTSTSFSSLRSIFSKYFQRNRTKTTSLNHKESSSPNEKPLIKHDLAVVRTNSNGYHHVINQKRQSTASIKTNSLTKKTSSTCNRHTCRQTTTATFTGQKRCLHDVIEDNQFPNDLIINSEEEQQFVRTRVNTRTASLPITRCGSYYYYHQHSSPLKIVTTKAIIEGQHCELNDIHHYKSKSLTSERSRSQSHSHSSGQCLGNGVNGTTDTDHSSSFENNLDDEQRRLNRRNQPSCLSTSYNSNRYSQRAVAQFMHERHKARLRRNQKASRMLGKIDSIIYMIEKKYHFS